jgi:hypothetical protein
MKPAPPKASITSSKIEPVVPLSKNLFPSMTTEEEREHLAIEVAKPDAVASYGGMFNFMRLWGISPYDDGAEEEAQAIANQIDNTDPEDYVSWDRDGNLEHSPGGVGNAPKDKWRTEQETAKALGQDLYLKLAASTVEFDKDVLEMIEASKPRDPITLQASKIYPSQAYRSRILKTFSGIDKFMKANYINPAHERATEWVSDILAGMEDKYETWKSQADTKVALWETSNRIPKVREGKGMGNRRRRRGKDVVAGYGGMENFMASHGIKPYEDGAFEKASAILEQLEVSNRKPVRSGKKRQVRNRGRSNT